MAVRLGEIRCDATIEDKLRHKTPSLTSDDVREALQWPALAEAGWVDHEVHGRRVEAVGFTAGGEMIIAALAPLPEWDEDTDTWNIMTARKV